MAYLLGKLLGCTTEKPFVPCRECGGETETLQERITPRGYRVSCKECLVYSPILYPTKHAARKAWLENPDEPTVGGKV